MGLIKKLVGGFLSFLGGIFSIFNIFKKSEYYLEADTVTSVEQAPPVKAKPEKAEVKPAAPEAAASNGKVAEPVATVAAAAPVVTAPPKPAATPAAPPALFAPNNIITNSTGSRRRPGPSMNRFLDMAKQVKA